MPLKALHKCSFRVAVITDTLIFIVTIIMVIMEKQRRRLGRQAEDRSHPLQKLLTLGAGGHLSPQATTHSHLLSPPAQERSLHPRNSPEPRAQHYPCLGSGLVLPMA
jgi:hypothetical protein